jgi:hypothetical protein
MEIKKQCWDEEVGVEVSRDGTLTMYGYDSEYDQAMAEFHNENTSVCLWIAKEWDINPAVVIDYELCPNRRFRSLLALDMVDHFHTSELFERMYPEGADDDAVAKHQALIAEYLEVVRETFFKGYASTGSARLIMMQLGNLYQHILPRDGKSNRPLSVSFGENYTFGYFVDAMDAVYDVEKPDAGGRRNVVNEVVSMIASAVAYASAKKRGPEFDRVYDAEVAWFVRRFVDVFEAHEAGETWPAHEAGELWPPLELTP